MSLVGWWPLDGDATDRVGTIGNGNLQGSPSFTNGKLGECMDADGSDDAIIIPKSEDFSRFTISGWINKTSSSNSCIFGNWFDNDGEDERAILFGVDSSGEIRFSIDATGSYDTINNMYSGATVNDGKWHHIVGTYDGEEMAIYIDGEKDISESFTDGLYNANTDWEIGSIDDGTNWNFEGKLDDVRFYDHVLSVKEIKLLSQAKVLHYKFNTDGSVGDASGHGNSGTVNGPSYTDDHVIGSGAYEFDGNSDYIDLPPEAIPTGNEVTVSFWSYGGSQHPVNNSILEAEDTDDNRVLNIHHPWGDETVYWDTDDGGSGTDRISKTADPSDYKGRWAYWTFTKNADTGEQKIYLDGELWHSETGYTGELASTDTASLGSYSDGTEKYWDGRIDDFRIYATELTPDEITEIYEQRASIDDGGNFHSHEITEPESRLIFGDETYDVVSNQYKSLIVTSPEDTDYSEWVESDDTLGNIYLEGLVHITDTEYYPKRLEFTKDNNDKGVYGNFDGGVDNWRVGWNRVFVKVDNWNNVSNTPWDDMDRVEVYRSGPDDGDTSQTIRFKDVQLLKFADNEPIEPQMSIEETGSLRSQQVSEIGPAAGSLVGYWPLNGNTRDYSGNGNHGTNNGATVTGGLGQSAYYFDGDDITIPHSSELDISGNEITVSLWKTGEDRGDKMHTLLDKHTSSTGYEIRQGWGTDDYCQIGSFSFSNDYDRIYDWDWEQVILRFKDGVVETFVNGTLGNSDTYSGTIGSNTKDMSIGSGWKGRIQDVRLYDRALTNTEVKMLYTLTDPRTDQLVMEQEDGIVHSKTQFSEVL